MPGRSDPRAALELASAACPQTPFVGVFATICEEINAHMMRGGAVECVLKERMALLPRAVQRAMGEKARQAESPPPIPPLKARP